MQKTTAISQRDISFLTSLLALATLGNKIQIMDHLHWQHLFAKPSPTVTRDCTCLGHLGQQDTDRIISIGQGKYIRHYIAGVIICNVALNFANVNLA
jgi:hypothetical protein